MSITAIPKFKHLSKTWKVEDIVSLAKSSVSNLEMETYPLSWHAIRMLYNQAIADLEDIIFTTDIKFYEIIYPVSIDGTNHNLQVVDLGDAIFSGFQPHGEVFYTQDDYFPIQHIKSLTGVFCANKGIFVEKTFDELVSISTNENLLYRHSMFYARNGDLLYLYGGEVIDFDIDEIFITCVRRIVLDDLKHPKSSDVVDMTIDEIVLEPNGRQYSWTYNKHIDIPDRFVKLLNLQMKKECLEYLSQPIPEELEGKIASIIRTLTTNIELEQVEQMKSKQRNV